MIIEIRTQGGFGGLSATPPHRIDTDAQPAALARDLCAAFGPDALARLAAAPCPDCADRMRYAITVTDQAGPHSVTLSEGQMPAALLDLIDRL